MEAVTLTLSDLWPIVAAVLGPMLAVMTAMMRYQHVDNLKTRALIDRNRDRIDESSRENRELIERLIRENRGRMR